MDREAIRDKAIERGLITPTRSCRTSRPTASSWRPASRPPARSRSSRAAASAWTSCQRDQAARRLALIGDRSAARARSSRSACRSRWRSRRRWSCARRRAVRGADVVGAGRRAHVALGSRSVTSPRSRRASSTAGRSTASSTSASFVGGGRVVAAGARRGAAGDPGPRRRPLAAIVIDELIGSREIVVKSVGPQIVRIRGIFGATILGDGRSSSFSTSARWCAPNGAAAGLEAARRRSRRRRRTAASSRWSSTTRSPCAASRSACSSATACRS